MVELQMISKIMNDRDISILDRNGITGDYFVTYKDEYEFIREHYIQYKNIPDKPTFSSKFPDFTFIDVTESEDYLVDTFGEEHLYSLTVPVVNKIAELIQTDSRAAVEYLQAKLPELSVDSRKVGTDIISKASDRLKEWQLKKDSPQTSFIPTGFEELDEIIGGWQMGEEFAVIFARTGQGKSWLLVKTLEHAWKTGKRVGVIEPEMSAIRTGYRFDTLSSNISNRALNRGEDVVDYEKYIKGLSASSTPFIVASPKEFRRKITVSKIRSFIQSNKLDTLGIDGISYLSDERYQRGDSRTISLTNISEDLMDLSIDLGIPIIAVGQSNRDGAKSDEAPDIENIRDSDGIAYNASIIIAAKQRGPGIELNIRKNRNGRSGDKLTYMWDIDRGIFKYVPDSGEAPRAAAKAEQLAAEYKGTEVF